MQQIKVHLILLISCLQFIVQFIYAQDIPEQIHMSVTMEPMLNLTIKPDLELEFGIIEINEDLYHVTKKPEDVLFNIESTTSWTISLSTETSYFQGEKDSTKKIPVEFVGYTVENLGTNWDNGPYSNIINYSKDTILELSSKRRKVLTNGRRNNIGGADRNSFIIHWKLLWERDAIRLKNFVHDFMTDERYKTNIRLTLSESLCTNCY